MQFWDLSTFLKPFLLDQGITWRKWPGGNENPIELSNMKLKSCMYIYIYVYCIYIICSIYFCWESPRFLWGKVRYIRYSCIIQRYQTGKLLKTSSLPWEKWWFSPSTENHLRFEFGPDFFFRFQTVSLLFKVGMDMGWIWFSTSPLSFTESHFENWIHSKIWDSIRVSACNMWFFSSRLCSSVSLRVESSGVRMPATLRIAACEILWDPFRLVLVYVEGFMILK